MRFFILILLSVCACFAMASCKEAPEVKQETKDVPRTREERILTYASVVKKVAPAVVNIYALQHAKAECSRFSFYGRSFL